MKEPQKIWTDGRELVVHLVGLVLAQGRPSTAGNDNQCRYLANGAKCAIGHAIPEHLYTDEIEGDSFDTLIEREDRVASHLLKVYPALMNTSGEDGISIGSDLQFLYDTAAQNSEDGDEFVENFTLDVKSYFQNVGWSVPAEWNI